MNLKSIKAIALLLLIFPLSAQMAWAQHGHGHGHGARVGIYIDPWPLLYAGPGYYPYNPYRAYPYSYAYPYPVTVVPAAPTTYVEQTAPAVGQSQGESVSWYYCTNPEGYYPYVRSCQSGWQKVPAQPVPPQ